MLLLDGLEYDVKTPEENTDDLITFINEHCASADIRNSLGEVIHIEDNEANPFYQLCFGLSYLTTVMQKLIYNAGCGMSVAESSPRQLLNIADIAGIHRSQPTRTVIHGVVYATEDPALGDHCDITQSMSATIVVSGQEIIFHPAFDVTIPLGESRSIVLIAEQYGSYNIAANTITAFDDPVTGFGSMTTGDSTPGQEEETIAALRERIQRRVVEGTQVERAATAIQNLEGVSMCNIFFNYNPNTPASVAYGDSSISVPARQALIMVQGWNNDIAKVFYRYMLCPTTQTSVEGEQVLTYTTKSGQDLSVYVIPPKQMPLYVRVYIDDVLSYEQSDGIKEVICTLAGRLIIGQTVTSVNITELVKEIYSNLSIQGADVATNVGESTSNWSYKQTPPPTSIFTLSMDNITIVERAAE